MNESRKTLFTVARAVVVTAVLFAALPETTPSVPLGTAAVSASALTSGEGCEVFSGSGCDYYGTCEGSHVNAWCDGEATDVCEDYCSFTYGTSMADIDCELWDTDYCHAWCQCVPIG